MPAVCAICVLYCGVGESLACLSEYGEKFGECVGAQHPYSGLPEVGYPFE